MKQKGLLASLVVISLTGCGSSLSCSSSDVKETVKSILIDASRDERVVSALSSMEMDNIATIGIDKDVGTYHCSAQLLYDSGDGKDPVTKDVTYEVQPIESEDSDFQVLYDTNEFGSFKTNVALRSGLSFGEAIQERFYGP